MSQSECVETGGNEISIRTSERSVVMLCFRFMEGL